MVRMENISYGSYISGKWGERPYSAVDDYFWKEVDGNIICTDNQCDIDHDGNILLITPEKDCLIIGRIPMLEEGAGNVRCSFDDDNNLVLEYRVFLDNSHHHSDVIRERIDTKLTPERMIQIESDRLKENLYMGLKDILFNGGSIANTDLRIWDRADKTFEVRILHKEYNRYCLNQNRSDTVHIVFRRNPINHPNGRYEISDEHGLYDYERVKDWKFFKAGDRDDGKGITRIQHLLDAYYGIDYEEEKPVSRKELRWEAAYELLSLAYMTYNDNNPRHFDDYFHNMGGDGMSAEELIEQSLEITEDYLKSFSKSKDKGIEK